MFLSDFAYILIFGRPLVFYMGIVATVGIVFAASVPVLYTRGIRLIRIKHHARIAWVALGLAAVHVILAISVNI